MRQHARSRNSNANDAHRDRPARRVPTDRRVPQARPADQEQRRHPVRLVDLDPLVQLATLDVLAHLAHRALQAAPDETDRDNATLPDRKAHRVVLARRARMDHRDRADRTASLVRLEAPVWPEPLERPAAQAKTDRAADQVFLATTRHTARAHRDRRCSSASTKIACCQIFHLRQSNYSISDIRPFYAIKA
jgi:hypothetical protein